MGPKCFDAVILYLRLLKLLFVKMVNYGTSVFD